MSHPDPIRLGVMIGSTREGRYAPTVADWFLAELGNRPDFVPEVIDVAKLPFTYAHPARPTAEILAYRDVIASAEAFVIVAAEYNHGYTAGLKNAIDLANSQWHGKPIAFVSYGGVSGGLRAVEQLRQVFAELHAVTVRDAVSFHHIPEPFDEEGQPRDPERASFSASRLLNQLAWWSGALRTASRAEPYPG